MKHGAQEKSPGLYLVIISVWATLTGLAVYSALPVVTRALSSHLYLGTLASLSMAFIAYFWLNGTKDVVYALYAHFSQHSGGQPLPPRRRSNETPAVHLVYCTCNDFNGDSLLASMHQEYGNYKVVILDDSTQADFIAEVDDFARRFDVEIVRRTDQSGFKAGNLNHYLSSRSDWQFFVILDSDEIVPPDFITRALDYFVAYPNTGIVQANHRATRNRNRFMQRFAIGVDSHWSTYQAVKVRFGFMSLLGHGAMVSRSCYQAAGAFPELVAEDLCFSIHARMAGLYTVFASDIMCEEEYPVDYLAFKKRHNKWTQGNMEFVRRYTRVIFASHMTWYEKLDIILFTYSLPLTALFSLYVAINVVVLPLLHYNLHYPLWMLAPTAVFLVAPMLNDILYYYKRMSKRELASYLLHSTLLYGSMFFVSLKASWKSAFGKSTFIVTPKSTSQVTFRQALQTHQGELWFGSALLVTAAILTSSILPVFLLAIPAIAAVYLAVDHQAPELPAKETPNAVVRE